MEFKLVPMTREHIPFVARLERENFSVPESEQSLLETLKSDIALYFTAFCGDTPVGYITAYVSLDTADILSVAVEGEYRRKGYGRRIIRSFADICRQRGLSLVTLEVRQSNIPARTLYESEGFISVGVRKGYYKLPKEDAVLYDLNLEQKEKL